MRKLIIPAIILLTACGKNGGGIGTSGGSSNLLVASLQQTIFDTTDPGNLIQGQYAFAYQYDGSGQETQALATNTSYYNGAVSSTSIDTSLFTYSGSTIGEVEDGSVGGQRLVVDLTYYLNNMGSALDSILTVYPNGYVGEPDFLQVFTYNTNSQVSEIDAYDEAGGSRTLTGKETFTYLGNDLEGDEFYMPGASTPYRIDLYGYNGVKGNLSLVSLGYTNLLVHGTVDLPTSQQVEMNGIFVAGLTFAYTLDSEGRVTKITATTTTTGKTFEQESNVEYEN